VLRFILTDKAAGMLPGQAGTVMEFDFPKILPTHWGNAVAQWLSYCATNRRIAGSIPDGVIGSFHSHNPSDRTMALGSTQPVTDVSRVEKESDGTRRSTGGEVKGKEANGVGSQHSYTVWERGLSSITTADAHTSAASSRQN